jgi:cytochrome c oxidase subunit 4
MVGVLEDYYWYGLGAILVLSTIKATVVAGYYQHLRWEPRSLTYLYLTGLGAALALTMAASYSIL